MTGTRTALNLIRDSIINTKRSIAQSAANTATKDIEGATVKDIVETQIVNGGILTGISAKIERRVNTEALNTIRIHGAETAYHDTMRDLLTPLQEAIGPIDGMSGGKLAKPIIDFFTALNKSVTMPNNSAAKGLILSHAQEVSSMLNQYSGLAVQSKLMTQTMLSEEVRKINHNINFLFNTNKEIISSSILGTDISGMLDERDRIINELSKSIPINLIYTKHNGVVIRSGTHNLIDEHQYAKFSTNEIFSMEEILRNKKSNPIYIETYTSDNQLTKKTRYLDIQNKSEKKGKLQALVDGFDEEFPKFIKSLDALASNFMHEINRVHNKGSGFPGYGSFTSTKRVKGEDATSWLGRSIFTVVQDDGSPAITDSGNAFPQLHLGLDKIKSTRFDQQATLREIVNEINNHFYPPATIRHSMGTQLGSDNKYLMNDFKIISTYENGGNFQFDFEAENSSDFGSKIQIVSANIGGLEVNINSELLHLDPHSRQRSFHTNFVDISGLTGTQNLEVEIRVIGDNGEVKNGKLNFSIDLDNPPKLNERLVGQRLLGALGGDIIDPPSGINYGRILKALIVDEHGNEITDDTTEGFLKIESLSKNYKLIIEDHTSQQVSIDHSEPSKKGFSHYFGLNNLFHYEEGMSSSYTMRVREDILSNPELLSTSRPTKAPKYQAEKRVGDTFAQVDIRFTDNTPDNYLDSTITINGISFNLVNNPTGPNDIHISAAGGSFESMMQMISSRLSQDKRISSIISFSVDGNKLIAKSKIAGSHANNFTIECNNPTHNSFNSLQNTGIRNFSGGTDKVELMDIHHPGYITIQHGTDLISDLLHVADYGTFLKGNEYIGDSFSNLTRYGVIVSDAITSNYVKISDKAQTSKSSLALLNIDYMEKYGANNDKIIQEVMAKQNHFSVISKLLNIILKMNNDFIRSFEY